MDIIHISFEGSLSFHFHSCLFRIRVGLITTINLTGYIILLWWIVIDFLEQACSSNIHARSAMSWLSFFDKNNFILLGELASAWKWASKISDWREARDRSSRGSTADWSDCAHCTTNKETLLYIQFTMDAGKVSGKCMFRFCMYIIICYPCGGCKPLLLLLLLGAMPMLPLYTIRYW